MTQTPHTFFITSESFALAVTSTKEKGETSKMPTMKIKKSHANP